MKSGPYSRYLISSRNVHSLPPTGNRPEIMVPDKIRAVIGPVVLARLAQKIWAALWLATLKEKNVAPIKANAGGVECASREKNRQWWCWRLKSMRINKNWKLNVSSKTGWRNPSTGYLPITKEKWRRKEGTIPLENSSLRYVIFRTERQQREWQQKSIRATDIARAKI